MALHLSKLLAVGLLSFTLLISSCGRDVNIFSPPKAEQSKIVLSQPLTLLMPTVNYNQRPENTKIDTVIIHHTAPFASLTRVGYFFQDINSRVSAHYTVGKDGLIIESVNEKDRAWHAGPSTWLGKYNVNDYSVGIELLNDGDHKDPFTEPQYNSLARLVAYLLKKYDIPLSRVIGHRDIAFPLGRKIDPADNFNWKLFKSKVRTILNQPPAFFGWGDLPQESNLSLNQVKKYLNSTDSSERGVGVDSLLTVDFKPLKTQLAEYFNKETNPAVKAKFFRLFEVYADKSYLEAAAKIFSDYRDSNPLLTAAAVSYLHAFDKDNAKDRFFNVFVEPELPEELRYSLIRVLSNYKDEKISTALIGRLKTTGDKQEKKVIIENLAKYENKDFNNILLPYLTPDNPNDLKITAIESLRVTFDENVENKLIDLLKNQSPAKNVQEAITWVLLRRDSKKGLAVLQEATFYNQLSSKEQVGLFNTLGKLKMTESEDWVMREAAITNEPYVKAAAFLALGKMQGENSFNYLFSSLKDNLSLNFILFKALSEFSRPELNKALAQVMQRENIPNEVKVLAVSTIKEKKIAELLPLLKAFYVENRNPDLDMVIEDTIESFEGKSEPEDFTTD